jgi:hypothetical protein
MHELGLPNKPSKAVKDETESKKKGLQKEALLTQKKRVRFIGLSLNLNLNLNLNLTRAWWLYQLRQLL